MYTVQCIWQETANSVVRERRTRETLDSRRGEGKDKEEKRKEGKRKEGKGMCRVSLYMLGAMLTIARRAKKERETK
jgi:hypothetical protein